MQRNEKGVGSLWRRLMFDHGGSLLGKDARPPDHLLASAVNRAIVLRL